MISTVCTKFKNGLGTLGNAVLRVENSRIFGSYSDLLRQLWTLFVFSLLSY
jgi:hypothetical protein